MTRPRGQAPRIEWITSLAAAAPAVAQPPLIFGSSSHIAGEAIIDQLHKCMVYGDLRCAISGPPLASTPSIWIR
jgi:hypothetical protein